MLYTGASDRGRRRRGQLAPARGERRLDGGGIVAFGKWHSGSSYLTPGPSPTRRGEASVAGGGRKKKKNASIVRDKDERARALSRYHLASPAHHCPGALSSPAGMRRQLCANADWSVAIPGESRAALVSAAWDAAKFCGASHLRATSARRVPRGLAATGALPATPVSSGGRRAYSSRLEAAGMRLLKKVYPGGAAPVNDRWRERRAVRRRSVNSLRRGGRRLKSRLNGLRPQSPPARTRNREFTSRGSSAKAAHSCPLRCECRTSREHTTVRVRPRSSHDSRARGRIAALAHPRGRCP